MFKYKQTEHITLLQMLLFESDGCVVKCTFIGGKQQKHAFKWRRTV